MGVSILKVENNMVIGKELVQNLARLIWRNRKIHFFLTFSKTIEIERQLLKEDIEK